jgi:hypothetical protein
VRVRFVFESRVVKFKKLGFIDYNGGEITIHSALLSVVLHD